MYAPPQLPPCYQLSCAGTRIGDTLTKAMRLIPYFLADAIPFTATREQVVAHYGRPRAAQRNNVGLNELDYGDLIVRFQDNGRLEEITRRAPLLYLGTELLPFARLADHVHRHDPAVFERGGFLVSPRFGLAFDSDCPPWITALAAHCIPTWRAMGQT